MRSQQPVRRHRFASSVLVYFIFFVFLNERFADSSYTFEVLKPAFEKSFHDRCTVEKYPFIEKFIKKLENPGDRFVHFVLHEHGFRNGGFGDRLAGLLTATAMALRFDRQILIQSNNGFDELFEPYHPTGIRANIEVAQLNSSSDVLHLQTWLLIYVVISHSPVVSSINFLSWSQILYQ